MRGVAGVSYEQASAGITNNSTVSNTYNTAVAKQGGGQPAQVAAVPTVTITGNEFIVRNESDIEKIAYDLAKYIEKEALQIG